MRQLSNIKAPLHLHSELGSSAESSHHHSSKSILLISFDFIKDNYADMTYSIAAILASLRHDSDLKFVSSDHYGINLSWLYEQFEQDTTKLNQHINQKMVEELRKRVANYDYIAIGVTTWSNVHVEYLVNEVLGSYTGKIILGGYEITAMAETELCDQYPTVTHFIKGYSETALKKILLGQYDNSRRIINEPLDLNDLRSPYLSGVLPLDSNSVHWETKRGCPYSCGFCEWGNAADKNVSAIDTQRLQDEIILFQACGIKEINILDGTFNYGDTYLHILETLLHSTEANITMQTRFENIRGAAGAEFMELCAKYSSRIKLEFGLQTIHRVEMKVIGRGNRLSQVISKMAELNQHGINYEVSLIYGIPGQTYQSFYETIQFVKDNGCDNVRAFPLRIPRNSNMERLKNNLGVRETTLANNVDQVTSSYSFNRRDYDMMQQLADNLRSGILSSKKSYVLADLKRKSTISLAQTNPYELKINKLLEVKKNEGYSREVPLGDVVMNRSVPVP